MPYITFSRNIKNAAKLYKTAKGIGLKDSFIAVRGDKTIRGIVELAASKGFNTALIIIGQSDSFLLAREIKISRKERGLDWKFAGEKEIAVKK